MGKVALLAWAMVGLMGAVHATEPPLANPQPGPHPLVAAPDGAASPADVVLAPGMEPVHGLAPAPLAFMDPRTFAWRQQRLPPPDQPSVEMACQLGLAIGDHRCWRERLIDCCLHWQCPGKCGAGKSCVH